MTGIIILYIFIYLLFILPLKIFLFLCVFAWIRGLGGPKTYTSYGIDRSQQLHLYNCTYNRNLEDPTPKAKPRLKNDLLVRQ